MAHPTCCHQPSATLCYRHAVLHHPRLHLYLACTLVSAWMFGLLVGLTAGGAVHVLLLAAVALWPWRGSSEPPP